ncbi:SDR family oxidoreductase [Ectothiorhodospiraceae bacterium WFHF3C12]|nr:SDR family oxidoreductase [Ectothiorhodospiraceae bacterium WFHF3C12]
MSEQRLSGKRVLITQSSDFMGPALCEVFAEQGAEVIADSEPLLEPQRPERIVADAGRLDVLVANLGVPAPFTRAAEVTDEEWREVFAHMVDPLPRLFRAVLPQMLERQAGKIILMGSASALRGMKRASTYSAARGAQLAYVQAVGVEVAPQNVQVNAIAQNFVDNPTYFPAEIQANPKFQERLKNEVPAGRLGTPREDALFAAFLASDEVNFLVGQAIPFCGGWATR